jgi:hypothetical protein
MIAHDIKDFLCCIKMTVSDESFDPFAKEKFVVEMGWQRCESSGVREIEFGSNVLDSNAIQAREIIVGNDC